MQMLIVEHREA